MYPGIPPLTAALRVTVGMILTEIVLLWEVCGLVFADGGIIITRLLFLGILKNRVGSACRSIAFEFEDTSVFPVSIVV